MKYWKSKVKHSYLSVKKSRKIRNGYFSQSIVVDLKDGAVAGSKWNSSTALGLRTAGCIAVIL